MCSVKKTESSKILPTPSSSSNPSKEPAKSSPSNLIDRRVDEPAAGSPQSTAKTETQKRSSKSTGPRTRQGKARSSLNASKHQIFSKRVLPDEAQQARALFREYVEYFRLRGGPEYCIGADLVRNCLEKRRIDRYADHELMMAGMYASERQMKSFDAVGLVFRSEVPSEGAPESTCTRATPGFAAMFLRHLKVAIQHHGIQPTEDLKVLDTIYGGQTGGQVGYVFRMIEALQQNAAEKKTKPNHSEDLTRLALVALESEIKSQELLAEIEEDRHRMECTGSVRALPSDHIVDRISRCYADNDRQRRRHLETLEITRRLGHKR